MDYGGFPVSIFLKGTNQFFQEHWKVDNASMDYDGLQLLLLLRIFPQRLLEV